MTLLSPFTLLLKELVVYVDIDEFEITYYHQTEETRQIVMEHNTEPPVVLLGHRSNMIIRYLKQFMTS